MTGLSTRRALAAFAALFGVLAAFAGSPYLPRHAVVDVERLAGAIAHEEDHVTAIELAEWIRDRKPGLHILDLRDAAEFDAYHLPRSERTAVESLSSTRYQPTDTLVLISGGGAHAAQGWVLLQALGYRQVYFLRGGLSEWLEDVMSPTIASNASPAAVAAFQRTSAISRYFGGVPRVVDPSLKPPRRLNDSDSRQTLTSVKGQGSRVEGQGTGSSSSSSPATSTAAAVAAMRRRGC
jgi:rhodanese-related sulfurtransferase